MSAQGEAIVHPLAPLAELHAEKEKLKDELRAELQEQLQEEKEQMTEELNRLKFEKEKLEQDGFEMKKDLENLRKECERSKTRVLRNLHSSLEKIGKDLNAVQLMCQDDKADGEGASEDGLERSWNVIPTGSEAQCCI